MTVKRHDWSVLDSAARRKLVAAMNRSAVAADSKNVFSLRDEQGAIELDPTKQRFQVVTDGSSRVEWLVAVPTPEMPAMFMPRDRVKKALERFASVTGPVPLPYDITIIQETE